MGSKEFSGRNRFLDLGLFEVDFNRIPEGGMEGAKSAAQVVGLDEGVLRAVFWEPAKAIGHLKWDSLIRKSGRTSGLTFGFVAGVYLDWKYQGKKTEEYFILQEKPKNNEFARKGDSGASIITNEGDIVGIVYARICMEVHIIIDKANRIPEIATIADKRRSDGSVDTKGLTTAIFSGECFILVQSVKLVLEQCSVTAEVIFDA